MSSIMEEREFKQIEYVWILNLIPPGSGIGLLYGCGPISFVLVLMCWFYLGTHFNLEAVFDVYMIFSILGTIGCVFHNLSLRNISLIEKGYLEKIYPEPLEIEANVDFSSDTQSLDLKSGELNRIEELGERTSFFEKCSDQNLVEIEKDEEVLDSPHMILLEANMEKLVNRASQAPIQSDESEKSDSTWQTNDPVDCRIEYEDEIGKDLSSVGQNSCYELESRRSFVLEKADTSSNQSTNHEDYDARDSRTDNEEFISSGSAIDNSENNELSENLNDSNEIQNFVKQRKDLLKKLGDATGEFQVETSGYDKFESSDSSFNTSSFDYRLPTSFESNFASLKTGKENGNLETEKEIVRCDCGSEVNASFSFCLTCGKIFS